MHVIFCAVDYIHIDGLSDLLVVQGTISVGDHVPRGIFRRAYRTLKPLRELRFFLVDVPHLQKQQRKALCCLAFEHDGCVLPVPEAFGQIDILICEIDASGEGCLAVDHKYLSVISVVVMRGYDRSDGRKSLCLDSFFFKQSAIVRGKQRHLAHSVVHHTHFNSLSRFRNKQFENLAPHIALFNYEIFQKDEFFGSLKSLYHSGKLVLAYGEVCDLGVVVYWKTACAVQVPRQSVHA